MKLYALFECTSYEGNSLLGVYTTIDNANAELQYIKGTEEVSDYRWFSVYEINTDQEPDFDCIRMDKELELA